MADTASDVVLTPLRGSGGSKILRIERVSHAELDEKQVQHVAGGPYKGIIISKATNETPAKELPDTSRSFIAHVQGKDGHDAGQEQRKMRFWFKKTAGKKPKTKTWEKNTDKFVRDLIYSEDFPKDYIGFVKRVLELAKELETVERLELEIRPIATATQDDQELHLGAAPSAQDTLQNGAVVAAGATKSGKSLDSSTRTVPSQDDQVKKHKKHKSHKTEAEFGSSDRAGTQHGPAMVAVAKSTTGGGGNQGFLDEITKEEAVVVAKSASTGGRGNPAYLAELQATEAVDQSVPQTGGRGSSSYEAELRRAELLTAAKAGPPMGTEMEDRVDVQAPVTVSGSRGSRSYEEELRKTQAVEHVEEVAVAQRAQGQTGSRGNTAYEAELRRAELITAAGAGPPLVAEAEERVDVQAPVTGAKGSRSYEEELMRSGEYSEKVITRTTVVKRTTTATTGARGRSSYDAFLKAGLSQDDYQRLMEGQEGATLTGANVAYSTASPGQGAELKRKIVVTRRGWAVIWAARKQHLLNILEEAYPNILSVDDMARLSHMKRHDCEYIVQDINDRGMVKEIERGRWMRLQKKAVAPHTGKDQQEAEEITGRKHDFQVVQHVPVLPDNEQPVIAIITVLYCEKLAVDSMMDPKTTYVRYKTEGESQVYTVGLIGKHRVVSTKLSRIGRAKFDMTAAGNNVTRLLGIFGKVEHVFLLGVAGGIANYHDDRKHVRLGDVVVSKPEYPGSPIYINCTGVGKDPSGGASFSTQSWGPSEDTLSGLMQQLEVDVQQALGGGQPSWEAYIEEGNEELQSGETRFTRPDPETDKLYRKNHGKPVDIPHPEVAPGSQRALRPALPALHYGVIACGKELSKEDSLRQEFALFNEVKAVDLGFKAVMESIEGNRKDSFAIIRGVSDYEDGTRKKEWQPYAALAAAAYMKALVLEIPAAEDDDDWN